MRLVCLVGLINRLLINRFIALEHSVPLICVCVLRYWTLNYFCTGEYVEVIVDYGGRVEDLRLKSQSGGQLRTVLLTHNGNDTAIIQNAGWMGMLLIPWANRIAYVSANASLSFE